MTQKQLTNWIRSAEIYWKSEDYGFFECLEKTKPDNATSEDVKTAYEIFFDSPTPNKHETAS